jgi:hypothetical protein
VLPLERDVGVGEEQGREERAGEAQRAEMLRGDERGEEDGIEAVFWRVLGKGVVGQRGLPPQRRRAAMWDVGSDICSESSL